MEIQFEQNRDFNQSHRDEENRSKEGEQRQPQGQEGDPNQRLVNREELDTEEKELDRRPADIANHDANDKGQDTSSAIAGVQDDQQNSTRNSSKPLGENPDYNAKLENEEDKEEINGDE